MKFIFDEKQGKLYKLESVDSIEYKIENNKFNFILSKLLCKTDCILPYYDYSTVFASNYSIGEKNPEKFLKDFEIDFFNFINGNEKIFNLEEEIKDLL